MDASSEHIKVLEQNWRRVASTHTLQDLLDADKPANAGAARLEWRNIALGLLLVCVGVASFVVGTFALLVAPSLPPFEHAWLQAIQRDRYYHLLLPLTVPVTIAAIFCNWFSMKLFKHNS